MFALAFDGTFLPKSSAALSGLRLRLSLPRIFRDAWLTALPARQAVPPYGLRLCRSLLSAGLPRPGIRSRLRGPGLPSV
jgi:hypothetical protein